MDHFIEKTSDPHRMHKRKCCATTSLSLKVKGRSEESVRRSSQSSHEKNEPSIDKKLLNR